MAKMVRRTSVENAAAFQQVQDQHVRPGFNPELASSLRGRTENVHVESSRAKGGNVYVAFQGWS